MKCLPWKIILMKEKPLQNNNPFQVQLIKMMTEQELLNTAITAAISGGKKILEIYAHEFEVEFKEDNSPLTLADRLAHEAIYSCLKSTGLPVLSEEGRKIPYEVRKAWESFWMVDPLDGTKEFIKRNGEFTVNIALISRQKAVMGVILVPVSNVLYFASRPAGAFKINLGSLIDTRVEDLVKRAESLPLPGSPDILTVVGSRSHSSVETENFISDLQKTQPDLDFVSIGSSLKLCLVAEGRAHLYPRMGPTMEWDTAAGQSIVEIAGGKMVQAGNGEIVLYNKPDLLNPWFVASRPF
jgi:3'(2'), 5'-bisphosphate nucleotidase